MTTNERTHKCETCSRSYKSAADLKAHEATAMHKRMVEYRSR